MSNPNATTHTVPEGPEGNENDKKQKGNDLQPDFDYLGYESGVELLPMDKFRPFVYGPRLQKEKFVDCENRYLKLRDLRGEKKRELEPGNFNPIEEFWAQLGIPVSCHVSWKEHVT